MQTGHNISPRLRKQLLELDIWKLLTELVELLPCSVFHRKASPLYQDMYQDMPDAAALLRLQHLLGSWQEAAISSRRGSRWRCRRISTVGLQQANMEDVVNACTRRQLQTVGERTDALQHTKRPGVARAQLALGARVQGLRRPVKEAQPHPVALRELRLAMMSVVVLGQLLCLEKTLARLGQDVVAGAEQVACDV
jgi:hypothetical protein